MAQDQRPNTQGTGGDPPAAQEARSGGRPTPPARPRQRRDGIDRSGPPPHRRPGRSRLQVYDGTTPPDQPTTGKEPKTGAATSNLPDQGGDDGMD